MGQGWKSPGFFLPKTGRCCCRWWAKKIFAHLADGVRGQAGYASKRPDVILFQVGFCFVVRGSLFELIRDPEDEILPEVRAEDLQAHREVSCRKTAGNR